VENEAGYLCPELTIVKDSLDVDTLLQCAPPGEPVPDGMMDCDLDNDGRIDWVSAENRGWSDLDGNEDYSCNEDISGAEGGPELENWITFGYDCDLTRHTWVGDQPGDATPLYTTVEARRKFNPYVVLPIFDKPPCEGDPRYDSNPGCFWHTDSTPPDTIHSFTSSAGQTKYYHIIDFSVFYISCVQTKKGDCPAATEFFNLNHKDPKFPDSYRAIEGYFVKGYVPGLGGDCEYDPDGPYTIYLDR